MGLTHLLKLKEAIVMNTVLVKIIETSYRWLGPSYYITVCLFVFVSSMFLGLYLRTVTVISHWPKPALFKISMFLQESSCTVLLPFYIRVYLSYKSYEFEL